MPEAGAEVRAYVSMCLGDPREGRVPVARVVEVDRGRLVGAPVRMAGVPGRPSASAVVRVLG